MTMMHPTNFTDHELIQAYHNHGDELIRELVQRFEEQVGLNEGIPALEKEINQLEDERDDLKEQLELAEAQVENLQDDLYDLQQIINEEDEKGTTF